MPRIGSKRRFFVRILVSFIACILVFSLNPFMFQDHFAARAASSDSYSGEVIGHNRNIGGLNDSVFFDVEGAKFVKRTDYANYLGFDATYYFEAEIGQSIRINTLAGPVEDPSYEGEGQIWANGLQVNCDILHNATLVIARALMEGPDEEYNNYIELAKTKGNGTLHTDYTFNFATNMRLWEIAWEYNYGKHSQVSISLVFSESSSTPITDPKPSPNSQGGSTPNGRILQIKPSRLPEGARRSSAALLLGGVGVSVNPFAGESLDNGDLLTSGDNVIVARVNDHEVVIDAKTVIRVLDIKTVPPTIQVEEGHIYVTDEEGTFFDVYSGQLLIEGPGVQIMDSETEYEVQVDSTGLLVRTLSGTVEVYDTENLKTVYVSSNQMVTKASGGILGDAVSFDPSLVGDWWSSELATVPAESIYATGTPYSSPYAIDIFGGGGDLFNIFSGMAGLVVIVIIVVVAVVLVVVLLASRKPARSMTRSAQIAAYCPVCRQPLTVYQDNYGPYGYCPNCNNSYRL